MIRLMLLSFVGVTLLPVSLFAQSSVRSAEGSPATSVPFQWVRQESGTTASLRGIDSVDGKVAWASGSGGTVLRTTDGGEHWMRCATPDADKDGATLDFRGVQAWDMQTAIVMASGPGDKSRLYRTSDGCNTWTLVLKNTDKDGFWDVLLLNRFDKDGELLGDPVNGEFVFLETEDGGLTWQSRHHKGLQALPKEGIFAASNSALFLDERYGTGFVTGGPNRPQLLQDEDDAVVGKFIQQPLPLQGCSSSAGGFSIETRDWCCRITVGGDYAKPNDSSGTAAYSIDGGLHWKASATPPHGYRSAVQWSTDLKAWITVGTNGSDISYDDGKTWQPVDNGNWNALSLPFVVGPKGRIARLTVTDR